MKTKRKANRKYKDSVFSLLFGKPEILRELYSAIEGVELPPDVPIKITTLTDVLYMDRINDLSFTVDDRLVVLVEHQSTINNNMPVRLLIYIGGVYEGALEELNVYNTGLVKIPKPEFIVLYNGDKPFPEHREMRLSWAFKETGGLQKAASGEPPLELIVNAYNINHGQNPKMLERSRTLNEYSIFINKVKEHEGQYKKKTKRTLAKSIRSAVKYCIENDILKDFLIRHGSRVVNMLYTQWDWKDAEKVWRQESYEEGREEGRGEGRMEGRVEGRVEGREEIIRMLKSGKTPEEIITNFEFP